MPWFAHTVARAADAHEVAAGESLYVFVGQLWQMGGVRDRVDGGGVRAPAPAWRQQLQPATQQLGVVITLRIQQGALVGLVDEGDAGGFACLDPAGAQLLRPDAGQPQSAQRARVSRRQRPCSSRCRRFQAPSWRQVHSVERGLDEQQIGSLHQSRPAFCHQGGTDQLFGVFSRGQDAQVRPATTAQGEGRRHVVPDLGARYE